MKTILAAPLFSLTAIVLTGCMVGPNYVKPSTPMAPAFKELPPLRLRRMTVGSLLNQAIKHLEEIGGRFIQILS
jgi:hypothetical protein